MSAEVTPINTVDAGSAIAQTPPGGLLAGIKKESNTASTPAVHAQAPAQDNAWFWDEGRPGEGARPEWLEPQYKSVADKARAHTELKKKLVAGEGKAPDNYDFADYKEKLDTANPHLQKFMETARQNHLSQDTFKEMIGTLYEYEQSKLPNIDAEIAKLGPNANAIIETNRRWAANHLSQEACDTLGNIGNTAEAIKLMDEIRQVSLSMTSQPPGSSSAGEGFVQLTQADWEAELAVPTNASRYLNDAKYRQEMQNKLKIILGED